MWQQLLFILLALALIWWMFRLTKGNPQAFSLQNINKSLTTLGILALILIGFITLLVQLVNH